MIASTKKEAYEMGLLYFFTGKPCINGHVALRHRSNRWCVDCKKGIAKKDDFNPFEAWLNASRNVTNRQFFNWRKQKCKN